jgi:predicted transcriptional regulator
MKNKIEKVTLYKVNEAGLEHILRRKEIPSGAKLVLLRLINRLKRKRYCWPKEETIGKEVGLSERQVRTHIKTLKRVGCFWIIRGKLIQTETGEYRREVNTYDFLPLLLRYRKEVKVK